MIGLTTSIYLHHPTYLIAENGDYLVTENDEYIVLDGADLDSPELCTDVLREPSPIWEHGLGQDPLDLVANTGILTFALDNSANNSAGLLGLYSPGHVNCLADFAEGMFVTVVVTDESATSAVRFVGTIFAIRPAFGIYRQRSVEVEVHDWMEHASQEIGILPIALNKRADEALALVLPNISIRPVAQDFDVGVETWDTIFDTDNAKMSMASLMQKLCRNEGGGRIFVEGDGALRFENRNFRNTDATGVFSIDGIMQELDVEWSVTDVINQVNAVGLPKKVDTTPVVVYKLQKTFPIAAGATVVLKVQFHDPAAPGGQKISATSVEALIAGTHIKFGSIDDGSTNDLIANLTFPQEIGGFQETITLTNIGGSPGYLNFLEIKGLGIYTYDPLTSTAEDTISMGSIGKKDMTIDLEQVSNPNLAHSMATFFLANLHLPEGRVVLLRFLCNQNADLAALALTLEPSQRFALTDEMTATQKFMCVEHIKYEQMGPALWCEILATKSPSIEGLFIWDTTDPTNHGWDVGLWTF